MRKAMIAAALVLGLGAMSVMQGCLLAAAAGAGAGAGYVAGHEASDGD
jgi:hypothetical protein